MKSNESKRNLHVGAAFVSILVALGACQALLEAGSQGPTVQAPRFEVDPLVAEALAESLAARLDNRGVGRRAGPRLGHSSRRGRAA